MTYSLDKNCKYVRYGADGRVTRIGDWEDGELEGVEIWETGEGRVVTPSERRQIADEMIAKWNRWANG